MSTDTRCRRRDRRHSIPESAGAFVEFEYPQPNGQRWRFTLIDLSVSGLSFAISGEIGEIESGTTLERVRLQAAGAQAEGELLVMHISPRPEGGVACGALFYPDSDADLRTIHDLLAGLSLNQAG